MNPPMIIQNQLLATKFFMPVASHPLILRPHLFALLHKSLEHPLTLISAPAGFGKTLETKAFFHEVMDTKLFDDMIQEMTARTEGRLVGLQLLGLSLQKHADPTNLLEEASGSQRYWAYRSVYKQ